MLVVPSKFESFGIVLLEAWTHGKPVIACRDTATACVVDDGVDGFLSEYGNSAELAGLIVRLLTDEPLRRALGARGQRKVGERYTWDVVGRELHARLAAVTGAGERRTA